MSTPARRKPGRRNLPKNLRAKISSSGKTYYYYDCGYRPSGKREWVALGSDYVEAIRKWADYEGESPKHVHTFREATEAYFRSEDFRSTAPATQKDYLVCSVAVLEFFDNPPAPLDAIEPKHVKQFHDKRSAQAKTRANREIAFFSIVFNFARREGFTSAPNPKRGVQRNTEKGRDVYVEHQTFMRLCRVSDPISRDALWLLYLTGQRVKDVVKMTTEHVKRDVIKIRQDKTGKLMDMLISPRLLVVLRRCYERRAASQAKTAQLLANEKGGQLTDVALRQRFNKIRTRAGYKAGELQMRDLRAKAGTDVKNSRGLADAQALLGHESSKMTEHYIKSRQGDRVKPTR